MKKKFKILLVISFFFFFLLYILANNSIGRGDVIFFSKLKNFIPDNYKTYLKETVFIFKNQNNLKKKLKELNELKRNKDDQFNLIVNKKTVFNQFIHAFKIDLNKDLMPLRKTILDKYILNESQISFIKKNDFNKNIESIKHKISNNFEVYEVKYYDILHFSILEKTKKKSNKLLIYNQGHGGNPYNFSYFIKIKEKFKTEGYDVMSLSMTGLGYNKNENINFPNINKKFNAENHETYSTYFDEKFSNKEPLSLMLSGNYFLIKNMIKKNDYKEVVMIGISGGGWYTTLLSSVITNINTSYSFAGTIPLIFRLYNDYGDWEQVESSLYDKVSYNTLYILSTLDENNKPNRNHYQIYNSEDSCCFKYPSNEMVKNIYDELNIKNFKVFINKNNKHSINTEFFFNFFFNSSVD